MGTGHADTRKTTLCIQLLTTMWGQMVMEGRKGVRRSEERVRQLFA